MRVARLRRGRLAEAWMLVAALKQVMTACGWQGASGLRLRLRLRLSKDALHCTRFHKALQHAGRAAVLKRFMGGQAILGAVAPVAELTFV